MKAGLESAEVVFGGSKAALEVGEISPSGLPGPVLRHLEASQVLQSGLAGAWCERRTPVSEELVTCYLLRVMCKTAEDRVWDCCGI